MRENMKNINLRIKIFETIRDIPYYIGSRDEDASCRAKAKLLGDLLKRIGLKCKVVRGIAKWSDLNLPKTIINLAERTDFDHFFVKAYIPERKKWINVDATWDIGLKRGFTINQWDGLSATPLACPVKATDEIKPIDLEFRNFNPKDKFTKLLNDWYANLRRQNG